MTCLSLPSLPFHLLATAIRARWGNHTRQFELGGETTHQQRQSTPSAHYMREQGNRGCPDTGIRPYI
jgi:hypothetical protein